MNREIRFRAWHTDLEDMTFSNGSVSDFWYKVDKYPSMYHVMQFTGMKDKNGREIYEGDIVEYDFSQQSILVDTEVIGVGEVVFVQNYAAFAIKGNDDESFESLNSSTPEQANEFKVIGNIYEENSIANIDNQ